MTEQIFSLEFLFDLEQISRTELEQKSAELLADYLQTIDLHIEQLDDRRIHFSLRGPLKAISTCHDAINDKLFDRMTTIRLVDEAGDEIRRQAYPIIAEIETTLRTFINRAMTEIMGFDWWNQVCPSDIWRNVKGKEDRWDSEEIRFLHPVELTTFDELISIVTGSSRKWKEDQKLSASDLMRLLSDCNSIEQLRDKLSQQLEFSIWDKVFVRYFKADEETEQKRLRKEWDSLREQITNVVIPARNRVMHHRPISFDQLQELDRIKHETVALITATKTELTETERAEAREDSQEYINDIAQMGFRPTLEISAKALREVENIGLRADWQQIEEMLRRDTAFADYAQVTREMVRREEAWRKEMLLSQAIYNQIFGDTEARQALYRDLKEQQAYLRAQRPTRPQVSDSEDEKADSDSNDTPASSLKDSDENSQ
jgi:hypothetical protein